MKKLLAGLLVASTISFGANANESTNLSTALSLVDCALKHQIKRGKATPVTKRFYAKAIGMNVMSTETMNNYISMQVLQLGNKAFAKGLDLQAYSIMSFDVDACFSLLNK